LFQHLHAATKPAHRALEHTLSLLRKPVTSAGIQSALKKFLGFHRAWEPGFANSTLFAPIMVGRGRSGYAASDLEALGMPPVEIACVAVCEAAVELHRSEPVAMGSLYVMEGSTLGGEVIARALRAESWVPAAGLHYFSPPDRQTRTDWHGLQAWAESRFDTADWDQIEQGAQETFALMNTWHSTR
jgi:heme oxygenase